MRREVRLRTRLLSAVTPLVVVALIVSGLLVFDALETADKAEDAATIAQSWDDINAIAAGLDGELTEEVVGSEDVLEATIDAEFADLAGKLTAVPDAGPSLLLLNRAETVLNDFHAPATDGTGDTSEMGAADHAAAEAAVHNEAIDLLYLAAKPFPSYIADNDVAADLVVLNELANTLDASLELKALVESFLGGRVDAVEGFFQYQQLQGRVGDAYTSLDAVLTTNDSGLSRSDAGQIFETREELDTILGQVLSMAVVEGVFDPTVLAQLAENPQALAPYDDAVQRNVTAIREFQGAQTTEIIDAADSTASQARLMAVIVTVVVLATLLGAVFVTLSIISSVSRRVSSVSASARRVADEQLPALVSALRDPTGAAELPELPVLEVGGNDEVGELSRAFSSLQRTLRSVASDQMDTLRKGVSEIFVTLARRNRSLVDRQLATLDRLERNEENPELLGEYYRLDHLATRMRRNAESLLVLAGTESQRRWSQPRDIGDVVRAAIGEVEDYTRIDVLAIEPVEIKGSAIADIAHLLSEVLDNATAFSPPESRVRVSGHFDTAGYLLSVSDRGMGMTDQRRNDLNALLEKPPIMGLALDATLGAYVVARLAERHKIRVRTVPGHPGTTVHVLLPTTVFEGPSREMVPFADEDSEPPRAVGEISEVRRDGPAAKPEPSDQDVTPVPVTETEAVDDWIDIETELADSDALLPEPVETPRSPDVTAPDGDAYWSTPIATEAQPAAPELPVRRPSGTAAEATALGKPGFERTASGLPKRSPGASFSEPVVSPTDIAAAPAREPGELRTALEAFQTSKANHNDSKGGNK